MSDYSIQDASSVAGQFQSELLPGERLLWSGKPSQKVIFRMSDWISIPFSLLWGGFAIFWEAAASGLLARTRHLHTALHLSFFSLWGIPFVLMGQYIIWGRFFYSAWRKARTYYALTNKRVIVKNGRPSSAVKSGYLDRLVSASLTTRRDGLGTIEFGPEPFPHNSLFTRGRNQPMKMAVDLSRLAFFDIPDAEIVYRQVQILLQGALDKPGAN